MNIVTIGEKYLFSNASGRNDHTFDRKTGKIASRFNFGYARTRFTVSEPFLMRANMDLIDLSGNNELVSSGPTIDSRECVGLALSNERIFYTSQPCGLQVSQLWGSEAAAFKEPWE